jgi:hypothetical protein
VHFDYLTQLLENYGFDLVSPEEAATTLMFPMPDGTATFDGMFHQMELDCKKKRDEMGGGGGGGGESTDTWTRQCRQEYGSALYMTPEEKQISFYNRYFIFRKNRNINAKQLKSSFLTYAGLQEEQDRASAAGGDDDAIANLALEKIAKASQPIDVASKPAIAAHILRQQKTEKQLVALQGSDTGSGAAGAGAKPATMKIKPKPKKAAAATVKASAAAAAAAAAAAEPEIEEAPSAPIAQIEKKIQKRTKKMKPKDSGDMSSSSGAAAASASAASDAPPPPAPKPKRQTKKKTDL